MGKANYFQRSSPSRGRVNKKSLGFNPHLHIAGVKKNANEPKYLRAKNISSRIKGLSENGLIKNVLATFICTAVSMNGLVCPIVE